MKVRYDKRANAAYIFIGIEDLKGKARTVPVTDNIAVDIGPNGELLGVEILNAKESIGLKGLKNLEKEKFNLPIVQYA